MKKVLGGLIILILVLLAGAPWYVGRQVETFYNQATEEMHQKNPTLNFTALDYQRGWFSSTITGSITFNTMTEEMDLPFDLRYKSEITHGPLFWSALSSKAPMGLALDRSTLWIEPTGEDEVELNAIVRELPSFDVESVVGFDKTISSVYSIAAYARAIKTETEPVDFKFSGLSGTGIFNWTTQDFDFKAEMPSLTITESEAEQFTIDSVVLSAQKNGGDSNVRYDIARIALKSDESDIRFNLDKPYISARGQEEEEVYNSSLEAGFNRLTTNERNFAPARLLIMLDNLDKASVDSLRDTLNEAAANVDEIGSDMYGMMMANKMMELLPEILKRSPRLTLDTLSLGTGEGETLTASGYAAVLGDKAANLPSMFLITQALDAEFEAALPKSFLSTFMDLGQLMKLIDQGVLTSDDKHYLIDATVKEGHVTLNGNTLM